MIQLSYCTFGLTELELPEAILEVHKAGYPGIELSFHRDQFNPFQLTDAGLEQLAREFKSIPLKPACVATASHFFVPSRPHEPSLICPDLAGRKRRIDLVTRGIHVARRLGVPLVTFGSGFVRDEHVRDPAADPGALLVDSIQQCLQALRPDDDITLLIEPEPGMFIETLDQAISLVDQIQSPHFRLHLDLCHMYCSEPDFVAALGRGAPYTSYLHVSDAEAGCNLKIIPATGEAVLDVHFAAYLLYFAESADFLLLDLNHPLYFHDQPPTGQLSQHLRDLVRRAGIEAPLGFVDYNALYAGPTEFDDEVFTYLISVPRLSFDVLERARPIIIYLRMTTDATGRPLMSRRVANTLTGIVHFHEIPGKGTLDFAAAFKALSDHGFSGYASVELYHHVAQWQQALQESFRHLSQYL